MKIYDKVNIVINKIWNTSKNDLTLNTALEKLPFVLQDKTSHLSTEENFLELGELLVCYLEQLDIDYVFGVPGGAVEPVYNALARSAIRNSVKPVIARHETGAAFMAQGYALETGKLGVCCATTGPGATNALTGVASAYLEEIPLLVITGQTSQTKFGRGALQDSSHNGVDTLAIYNHCTRYNSFISDISQFEGELVKALSIAFSEPKGPVHLTIPVDLMRAKTNKTKPGYRIKELLSSPELKDETSLLKLREITNDSAKLVLLIGEGAVGAIEEILRYARRENAYIVTTPGAKGLIDSFHPLYKGVFGFAGHDSAREILLRKDIDCVMAVGSSFTEWESNAWDADALFNHRLINVSASPTYLYRTPMAQLNVQGNIRQVFEYLLKQENTAALSTKPGQVNTPCINTILASNNPEYNMADKYDHTGNLSGIKPQYLMNQLSQRLPINTRFFVDAGNSTAWGVHYLCARGNARGKNGKRGWFRMSSQFASMGWAIGSSVGAAMGDPGSTAVCITGDGSMLMNGQEFSVAIAESLNMIFIVLNDQAFGMVKHGQRMANAEPVGFELPAINFAQYAKSMGATAYRVESYLDLYDLDFDALCQAKTPCLLDVCIDPEEVPPIGSRVKVLGGDV